MTVLFNSRAFSPNGLAVVAVTVLAVAGAGCSGGPGIITVNQLPATVALKLGQDVRIGSPDIRLRLVEIVEDTRCPVDVTCVTAGSAKLRFSVSVAGGPESGLFLDLGESDASLGLVVRFEGLSPERRVSRPIIPPVDYRATLRFSH